MVMVSAWLAGLFVSRRRWAIAIATAVAVAAIPCLLYLQLSTDERTRNTVAAARALDTLGPGSLHTDYYTARVLRLAAPDRDIRVWYHAQFDQRRMTVLAPPPPGAYALLDRQAAKVYSSSYQLPLPQEVITVPPNASIVWTHHAYPPNSVSRRLLETI